MYLKCKYTYENPGFCVLCIDDFKILKTFQNCRNFSMIFHRETSQAPTPSPPNVDMTFLVDKIDVMFPLNKGGSRPRKYLPWPLFPG